MIGQTLNRILNLRPGDLGRGWPFFAYYFLVLAAYSMGQVARDQLFLNRFDANQLPYADIAVAALVAVVVALYLRASRHAGLKTLTIVSLLFFGLNAFLFWWVVHYNGRPWLYPVLYVWVGIFGVLATTQVWTLANFVWTTREAKRLFSLLGSGGILGGIFGGFLSTFVANRFGTETLLIVVGVFVLLCAPLIEIIWRQRGTVFVHTGAADDAGATPPRTLTQSFRIIRDSNLLKTIAVLICISSIVTTAAGWQLKAVAKAAHPGRDDLAAFMGGFGGYTGVLALAVQLLLTSKILRSFGIGVALFVLPATLMLGSVGLLLSGTLTAAVLLKGSDKVFRYSVDTSAMQLLYLPIPGRVKLQVKSFIDTVIWRLGDGMAGLTLLIFATTLRFTPPEIASVTIVMLCLWMAVAYVARKQYIAALGSNMRQIHLDPGRFSVPVLDASAANLLAGKLQSPDATDVLYALDLFEMGQQHDSYSAVRGLLEHPAPEVRQKAVEVLNTAGDKSARALIAPLLRDRNPGVRTEALLYITQHDHIDPLTHIQNLGEFADYSIRSAIVAFLAREGETANIETARLILDGMVREEGVEGQRTRAEAARVIGALPDLFDAQLDQLLHDPDMEVMRNAIRAAATLRKRHTVPLIVERLHIPELRIDAIDALLTFEGSIAGTLRDYLIDRTVPVEIRREIPPVLVRLGTPEAVQILVDNLLQADSVLRFRIISALNKLLELHQKVVVDTAMIESILLAEIMGHYRSYQILANSRGEPTELLRESMKDDLERIFRLMKLLSPEHDLQSAYRGLQSKHAVTHANALEFLDNTLKPQLRSMLVPLIDTEVSERERVQLADRFLGVTLKTHEEAIAALRSSEDPWLKSCAELWASNARP